MRNLGCEGKGAFAWSLKNAFQRHKYHGMADYVLTHEEKKLLEAIGLALLSIQAAEKMITFCLTFVIQKNSPLTLESLERQESEERKKTLGYFLGQLRERAGVNPD